MSAIETCSDCHAGLVKRKQWKSLTAKDRERAHAEGIREKAADNLCRRCAQRRYARQEFGESQAEKRSRMRAERLEDIEFMHEHGENLAGVAQRLGLSEWAVEQFLMRVERRDLLTELRWRNPRDHNTLADGYGITRAVPNPATDRKNTVRNERRKAQRRQKEAA